LPNGFTTETSGWLTLVGMAGLAGASLLRFSGRKADHSIPQII
jgi:hypothetical protein